MQAPILYGWNCDVWKLSEHPVITVIEARITKKKVVAFSSVTDKNRLIDLSRHVNLLYGFRVKRFK